jgi:excisionase family DNA binding protein
MNASRHSQTSDLSPAPFAAALAPAPAPTERAIREPYVVTIAEAAERKGCSIKAIEEAIARGEIRQPRRGDGSKVLLSSLEEWMPPRRSRTRK